ncbi:MAG: Hpt domain-containing protein [Treponema sp.]|nr:Hpt domain-containing protein [Treponema sp.]MCL2237375.1 Hpt domain-containing protein [Treponema sp.]
MKYMTPKNEGEDQGSKQLEADMEFLKNIQSVFYKTNKNKYKELTDALEIGDIDQAYRAAHSLKSNAGQLGKIILQKTAADIELNLKEGKNLVTSDQLNILKTELDMVLNEFAPVE